MNQLKANKIHIGILGKRNAGKSTLMNILLGQDFSIISDVPGTTTDVNQKSMEFLPIGPVVFLDTAGVDDTDNLGSRRVEKTYKALERIDCALFVCDFNGINDHEEELLKYLKNKNIPTVVVVNKTDLGKISAENTEKIKKYFSNFIFTSLKDDKNIVNIIKNELIKILPPELINSKKPMDGIIQTGESVILVIPIDKEAPKDRLILPQVQIIRSLIDNGCVSVVCDVNTLPSAIRNLKSPPKMVITDSQAFYEVSKIVPGDIMLTSFSIIFAQHKGDLRELVSGANGIDSLNNNDRVLICESCTHHPIEDDIGRVKIPNLIKKYTDKNLIFEHYSGYDFPSDIDKYSLIIHCGACMTNRKEMLNRIEAAKETGIPITNYGVAIAKCLGILPRAIQPFEKIICFD